MNLIAHCHSDWLGCKFSRKSRTGYLALLGGSPISWKSKKQSVVSRSSAQAEYRAMATTVSEILWLRWMLKELDVEITDPTPLFCDNQAARHIANNPVFMKERSTLKWSVTLLGKGLSLEKYSPCTLTQKNRLRTSLPNR